LNRLGAAPIVLTEAPAGPFKTGILPALTPDSHSAEKHAIGVGVDFSWSDYACRRGWKLVTAVPLRQASAMTRSSAMANRRRR
jgi:hypothetical protein